MGGGVKGSETIGKLLKATSSQLHYGDIIIIFILPQDSSDDLTKMKKKTPKRHELLAKIQIY